MRRLYYRLKNACTRIMGELAEKAFEWRYGPETSGDWFFDDAGPPKDLVWYVPTDWFALRRALSSLAPTNLDTFLDIGMGKGRAVLAAAQYPFAAVVGIELEESLSRIGRKAVARNTYLNKCKDVRIITADALAFEFPASTTVIYLYCPFVGEVFSKFIERLLIFADSVPQALRLMYNYPMEHSALINSRRFLVQQVHSARWPAQSLTSPEVIVTYRVLSAAETLENSETTARHNVQPKATCWLKPYDPGFVVRRNGKVWYSSRAWRS